MEPDNRFEIGTLVWIHALDRVGVVTGERLKHGFYKCRTVHSISGEQHSVTVAEYELEDYGSYLQMTEYRKHWEYDEMHRIYREEDEQS